MEQLKKLTTELKIDSEPEVTKAIARYKEQSNGIVTYKTAHKQKKSKGEVIDEFYILTITEDFSENLE